MLFLLCSSLDIQRLAKLINEGFGPTSKKIEYSLSNNVCTPFKNCTGSNN